MANYDEVIQKLEDIGFKVKTEYTLRSYYIVLERTVEQYNTHRVVIEDHCYERAEKDFDPKRDIGDWVIFSCLTDDERDWFGRFVETQYPLTLKEVHLLEELIACLEEKCNKMLDEAGV